MTPYQRPSGIWYLDFKPTGYPHRIRRSTGLRSKRRARQVEATLDRLATERRWDVLDAVREGDLHPTEVYSADLEDRLDELLEDEAYPDLEARARAFLDHHPDDRHKYAIRRLLKVAPEGATTAWLLEPEHLRELLAYYREEDYAILTEHREMSAIRQLIRQEFDQQAVDRAFDGVRLREKPRRRTRYLEADEIERVRTASGDWWLVFGLYLATGMRRGELLELKVRDVDLEEGTVTVEAGKSSRARRRVPIGGEVLTGLRGWVAGQGLDSNDPLFPEVDYQQVGDVWEEIRERANIEDATIHSLRHTFAVHMARARMPMLELKYLLGHSKLETTMRYAEYRPTGRSEDYYQGLEKMGVEGEKPTIHPQSDESEDAGDDLTAEADSA